MRQFKEDVQVVINTVQSPIFTPDSVLFHQKVFTELNSFLEERRLEYCEYSLSAFLYDQRKILSDQAVFRRYSGCISRLADVIRCGKVSRTHLNSERVALTGEYLLFLENYIEWIRYIVAPGSINTYRWSVSLFLRYAQSQNTDIPEDWSIGFFESFIDLLEASGIPPHSVTPSLAKFAEYLELKEMLKNELHWFFHDYPRVKRLCDYSDSFVSSLDSYRNRDSTLSLSEYQTMVSKTLQYLNDNDYKGAVKETTVRTFRLLYHFLSRSGLPYHTVLAEAWVYENKDIFLGAWYMARRALDMLASIAAGAPVSIRLVSDCKYRVPEWAIDHYHDFIQLKKKERYEESTVRMFQVCIKCFLAYLEAEGIHSYADITPEVIHSFNRDDKHKTNYAKNAYNTRIRRYLEYLELKGATSRPSLHYCLARASSSGERIVDILSSEEIEMIEQYCKNAETPIELRDSAMIMMGLKMGFRSSDVINLKLNDIDWSNSTIRIIQVKTKKELCLPMPVAVGNAIYAYLLNGRPRNILSTKVFVSSWKPDNGPITGEILRQAIRNALPDRRVPRSGFHVLRRTFSSITLNSGNTPVMVAELLGHSGPENVHKYLSMDSVHMRPCTLSYSEAGIGEVPHAD